MPAQIPIAGDRRPKYYDLSLARLPLPGLVSIFHRVTGVLLFFPVLPAILYLLQATLGSEAGYERWRDFFGQAWVKVLLLGFIWLYAHHFFAGIRFLLIDVHVGVRLLPARRSAAAVFVLGVLATLAIGWRLW